MVELIVAEGGERNSKGNPVERIRDQINAGKLTGDRLNEARAWLGAELHREEMERKRKRYGVQLVTLFLIAVVVLTGGSWAVKKLIWPSSNQTTPLQNR
jgi:hypothetical protein